VAFVRALVRDSGEFAVPLAGVAQLANRREEDLADHLRLSGDVHLFAAGGDVQCALEESCRQVKSSLKDVVRECHAAHPLLPGMDLEEARAGVVDQVPQKIFRMMVEELVAEGSLVRDGAVLALPGHRVEIPEADRAAVERIRTSLASTPLAPPDVAQLAADLGVSRQRLSEILGAMERHRTIVSVAPDLYFLRDAIDRVRDDLTQWLSVKQSITAADFRDRFKTTRKYAIPLLEYFDRKGITMRKGDVRLLRRPMQTETA
jgi:selenocysteine-specific elongation factor